MQAGEDLAHERTRAFRCHPTQALAAKGTCELADWQRKAVNDGNGWTLRSISRSPAALVLCCQLSCQKELTILEHQDEVDERDDRVEIADE